MIGLIILFVKIKVPVITVEENGGAGMTTLLQIFRESLSNADKYKIRVEGEQISEFQNFYGNKLIDQVDYCYQDPVANALFFQNYVLDVYRRLE